MQQSELGKVKYGFIVTDHDVKSSWQGDADKL